MVNEAPKSEEKGKALRAEKEEIIEVELAYVNLNAYESEYYTLEELEQMEDKSMAYLTGKFSHIRFKRNTRYKFKGISNRFQKGNYSSGSSSRGGFNLTSLIAASLGAIIAMNWGTSHRNARSPGNKGKSLMRRRNLWKG